MSRAIKFRAWDVFAKEMDYEVTIDPDGKVAAFNPLDGQYVRGFSDDEKVIMQYTGLKDRNGKEIYEGDILKVTYTDERPYIGRVEYRSDRDYPAYDLVPWIDCEMNALAWLKSESDPSVVSYEVIGNIYETPLEDTP